MITVGIFFQELTKKLTEKWASLLVLPGVVFLAAIWVSFRLGHSQVLHTQAWIQTAEATKNLFLGQPTPSVPTTAPGQQVLFIAFLLLASTVLGLMVQALTVVTRALWLGDWPTVLTLISWALVNLRRRRWRLRDDRRRRLQAELQRLHSDGNRLEQLRSRGASRANNIREHEDKQANRQAKLQKKINTAAARTNRIALAEPGRPTWMGDRMHAVERAALDRHGFDLTFAWPRLWLILPETTQTEIRAAHAAFASAVAVGSWAWPYMALSAVCWPTAIVGGAIALTGWARARDAIADLSTLTEAAIDLHGRTLAIELGAAVADTTGPLTITEGQEITRITRKGR